MNNKAYIKLLLAAFATAIVWGFSANVYAAVDAEGAEALAKKNGCFKCHAIDKSKKGPSYKKIAAKYKGKEAEGVTKMTKNMTENPIVKLEDGSEEEHKKIDATPDQIKNLISWILSL